MPHPPRQHLLAWCTASFVAAGVAFAGVTPRGVPGHGVHGQPLAQPEQALGFSRRMQLEFITAPVTVLPPVDEVSLLMEDDQLEQPAPLRFGVQVPVDLSLSDGQWVQVDGGRVWRCELEAIGSLNTRLHLRGLHLGAGEQIYLDAPGDDATTVGPIEGAGPFDNGEAWGVFTNGPSARLEWFVPEGSEATALPFEGIDYGHGYRDIFGMATQQLAAACGNQPSCHPTWSDLSNAAGRIAFTRNGGNFVCSGQLMATVAADETPYFSTANHCIKTQTEANSAGLRFFYRTGVCDGELDAWVAVSGGTDLVATHAASDSTLLMIRGALPSNVRWAGWLTTNPANGTPSVCVHHPRGFPQEISFGTKIATDNGCGASYGPNWSRMTWSLGTTESGSSGSGLYEESSQMLYGVLTCGTSGCSNPTGWDGFGRWDVALSSGGFAAFMAAGTDDAMEPNDTCAAAHALQPGTYTGLIAKRVSPDLYAIYVPAGQTLTVSSVATLNNGDVDFRLWSACDPSALLSDESGNATNESFSYSNTSGSDTLLLETYLSSGTRNTYALTIGVAPSVCSADLDADGEVGASDISWLLLDFGDCPACPSDLDGDGVTGGSDLALLLLMFGPCE